MASDNAPTKDNAVQEILFNNLIFESILENLPIRALKISRLVNSRWNMMALKEIQKKNWDNRSIIKYAEEEEHGEFEAFLNCFRNKPENIPYFCHKFSVFHGKPISPDPNVRQSVCADPELMRKYFHSFKKQIKGINITGRLLEVPFQEILEIIGENLVEIGIQSDTDNFSPILRVDKSSEKLLPNLKSISVDAIILPSNTTTAEYLSDCNIFLKNILSNMRPNSLEELNFQGWGDFDLAVKDLIEFNQVRSLKKLTYYPSWNSGQGNLSIFKEQKINLELEELKIHNENPCFRSNAYHFDIDPEELLDFLMTQRNSLRNLNLICWTYLFPNIMEALTTLKIKILRRDQTTNTMSLKFKESFPNLKNLYLWNKWQNSPGINWDKDQHVLSEQERCETLRKLTLPVALTLSVESITRILRVFPKLSSLELKAISNEVFWAIWNHDEFAYSLRTLILWIAGKVKKGRGVPHTTTGLQLDHIFSGVPQEKIPNIVEDEFNFDNAEEVSVLKLKNLRKLHLYLDDLDTSRPIRPLTDFTGLHVFGKMKNLVDLLVHRNIHQFSDARISRLKKTIQKFHCGIRQRGRGDERSFFGYYGHYDYLKKKM